MAFYTINAINIMVFDYYGRVSKDVYIKGFKKNTATEKRYYPIHTAVKRFMRKMASSQGFKMPEVEYDTCIMRYTANLLEAFNEKSRTLEMRFDIVYKAEVCKNTH